MEEILQNIKIIHASDALITEGIIPDRAKDLSSYIDYDGVQNDPIIVAKEDSRYIVLDGMHRVEALRVLGSRDILVYQVDYSDEKIILSSWDAIIRKSDGLEDLVKDCVAGRGIEAREFEGDVRDMVCRRRCYFGFRWSDRRATIITPSAEKELSLDDIISTLEECEKILDEKGLKLTYLADTHSDISYSETENASLMIRPRFTKEEVVARTLSGKIFPRKTTRHIIPHRPLKVRVKLSLLCEDIDIDVKNKLLQAELRRLNDHGRIRFYPDSIFLFNE